MRTAHAGRLSSEDIGNQVRVAGWVATRRDHGGVLFVDLRDASGIVQVVINPEEQPDLDDVTHALRDEFCISVLGSV
ncbi:MAG: hypothetical protein IH941_14845, partial [Acidobacteria bacterium]|nr:hypothetical protein [Acidobacteriota bacterium]